MKFDAWDLGYYFIKDSATGDSEDFEIRRLHAPAYQVTMDTIFFDSITMVFLKSSITCKVVSIVQTVSKIFLHANHSDRPVPDCDL